METISETERKGIGNFRKGTKKEHKTKIIKSILKISEQGKRDSI